MSFTGSTIPTYVVRHLPRRHDQDVGVTFTPGPRRPLPSHPPFPAEIWREILLHTVPTRDDFKTAFTLNEVPTPCFSPNEDRRHLATSYALVSTLFHDIAMPILWEHITVRTRKQLGDARRGAQIGTSLWQQIRPLGFACRRLDLRMQEPWTLPPLQRLLQHLPNLEILIVDNSLVDFPVISDEYFRLFVNTIPNIIKQAQCHSIRRLETWGLGLPFNTNDFALLPATLPSLESLHLTGIISPDQNDVAVLNHDCTVFKSLTTLSFSPNPYPTSHFAVELNSIVTTHDPFPALRHFDVHHGDYFRLPMSPFYQRCGGHLLRLSIHTGDPSFTPDIDVPGTWPKLQVLHITINTYQHGSLPVNLPQLHTIIAIEGRGMRGRGWLHRLESFVSSLTGGEKYPSLRHVRLHLRNTLRRGWWPTVVEYFMDKVRACGYHVDIHYIL
ncbi:hypothetical protein DFP72DRAFT_1085989 [Ephemerocybe angulata]|uniref:Uncharacterized protein n=1 Tax=Ephemerocybe angulata TaxID=980116 RepID=A0A8H6H7G0_9AGAR|nr:hypothetical protein DFP72DRAFT_1085989 [Tulosesus angulatus]